MRFVEPALDSGLLVDLSHNLVEGKGRDFAISALLLAMGAMFLGYAVNTHLGTYDAEGMEALTVALGFCVVAVWGPRAVELERIAGRVLVYFLTLGILLEGVLLFRGTPPDSQITQGIIFMVILGCLQAAPLKAVRIPLVVIMACAFIYVAQESIRHVSDPGIDVFMFQQRGCYALLHHLNPYTFKYPNVYNADTPYYGPGVVGADQFLTYGFPYPPLSLLMVLPAYLLGHDPRYADMVAIALSAVLMAVARPGKAGRYGALAAALFLLTPRVLLVVDLAWTESLLVFTFSLAMFCAFRWRKALPIALGLFFATKQYTIFAVPLLPLLVNGPNRWRELRNLLVGSALVVAAINLPFFLWNPRAFWRAIVMLQIVQPFRQDAMSYLVVVYQNFGVKLPFWIGLLAVAPAIALGLWRCPRTPSGFAMALTLTLFVFFAFNKQAFCNYYYFAIATACWGITSPRSGEDSPLRGGLGENSPLRGGLREDKKGYSACGGQC
jgi:hypothetical protein